MKITILKCFFKNDYSLSIECLRANHIIPVEVERKALLFTASLNIESMKILSSILRSEIKAETAKLKNESQGTNAKQQ